MSRKTKLDLMLELCKEYGWGSATKAELEAELEHLRTAGDLDVKELTIKDGVIDIIATPQHDLMVTLAAHMRKMLNVDGQPADAGNYVEFQFTAADDPTTYVLTLRPTHKPTPHQLRKLAERRLDTAVKGLNSCLSDPANTTRYVRETFDLIERAVPDRREPDDNA